MPVRLGSYVEEQVPAFLGTLAKRVKQDIGGTPAFSAGISPEPPVGHLTGLPQARLRLDGVLRGAEIAGRLRITMNVLRAGVRGFQGTEAVVDQINQVVMDTPGVANVISIPGFDLIDGIQNPSAATLFVIFKHPHRRCFDITIF